MSNDTTETPNIPKLDSILGEELRATGQDIPAGSYGATLFGFGEPFLVATAPAFRKPGDPEKRLVFDSRWGTYDKDGVLVELTYLLPVPDGGAANRKSNLYKMLKALAAGSDMIDGNGNIKKGLKLTDFYGRNGVLAVEKNAQDWPQVKSVAPAMAGIKYPTAGECVENLKGSKEPPF